ncbi:MAG: YitT family protein [Candidatus Thioglobus sp.]|nr:YitT family protein [Candidatus Thioglobus sp.]
MQAKKFNSSKAKKTKKITSSKPKFQQKNAAADGYILWSLFGLLLLTYYLFWADFFPNNASALGHDYRYVMPRLLAGYYWFETNGLWAVPYFTPSYCGGDVFFTDPQNNYFSIPQFLTFIINPLAAIKWTVLIFSVIGFSGFYLLLRRIFQLPVAISFFAAALFFLNDYFIYRMIIGHVGYHPFMLLPWVVLALFWQRNGGLKQHLISSTLTAAIFAYVFYGGGVHLLIPMFLMVIILLIIAKLFGVEVGKIYLRLGLFIGMVLLLSGAKLSIALATLANLPRSHLPLDGIHSFFYAIWLPIKALFFAVPTYEYTKNFIGHTIILSRHEFQIGVSIVPLIIIIIGFISKFSAIKNRLLQHKILAIILIGLLLIPIFVNYYTPAWNAFLKQIPIIKNSYSLFRWYSIFIPLVILLAALLLNIWRLNSKQQWLIVIGFLALALAQKFSVNNDYDSNCRNLT